MCESDCILCWHRRSSTWIYYVNACLCEHAHGKYNFICVVHLILLCMFSFFKVLSTQWYGNLQAAKSEATLSPPILIREVGRVSEGGSE